MTRLTVFSLARFAFVASACLANRAQADPRANDSLDELAALTEEYTGDHYAAVMVRKLHTISVDKSCWKVLNGSEPKTGAHAMSTLAAELAAYAKRIHLGDLKAVETGGGTLTLKDREINYPAVDKIVDELRKRVSITIVGDGLICNPTGTKMLIGYWSMVSYMLGKQEWETTSGRAHFKITLSNKVKDISVVVGKDESTISITGPAMVEVSDWSGKIERPLTRHAMKR